MSVVYPLDTSGVSPGNLVENELHSVSEGRFFDYALVVPNLGPIFVDNFKLRLIVNNVVTPLAEDVDFSFALPYVTGTRVTGKQMYGAVTLHNLNMNGILSMDYQTIGGDQVADRLVILSTLADKAYNPRTTIWDVLTNVPNAFPPVPHYQDYDDFKGQEAVVEKLGEIRDAILQNSSLTSAKIEEFLAIFDQGGSGTYVKKSGDTMTGPLALAGVPVEQNHAATKAYVDANTMSGSSISSLLSLYVTTQVFAASLAEKLNLAGGVMTGPLTLGGDPQLALQAATKRYVDTLVTNQGLNVQALQNTVNNLVNTGVSKQYVDDKFNEIMAYLSSVVIRRT